MTFKEIKKAISAVINALATQKFAKLKNKS